jgi:hypothetical protein
MKTYLTRMPWFVAGAILVGIAGVILAVLNGSWLTAWTVLVITGLLAYNEALNQVNVDLRKQRDYAQQWAASVNRQLIDMRLRTAVRNPQKRWED